MSFNNAFFNKRVLITGHTGFKGSWLLIWLKLLGAKVAGLSLEPPTNPSHYEAANLHENITDLRVDIRDRSEVRRAILELQPDFIFHLAAQALVRRSYDDPLETWETNLMGTLNILEGLRALDKPCCAVLITSDKCYDNVEWVWGYRETDPIGGPDPYSASKGAAELVIRSHIHSFFPKTTSKVRIASARAGNVIGGGDWGANRIIPDCVRAWAKSQAVELRSPNATRPWQHVLEPLSGYLNLAIELNKNPDLHGEPFNFGPSTLESKSVEDLVRQMEINWNLVKWKDVSRSAEGPYESGLLKLNCDKALFHLKWRSVLTFEETIELTANWYKTFYSEAGRVYELSANQINTYGRSAKERGVAWAQ